MLKLMPENTVRKIDSSGRISMPKGMKDRLGFDKGTALAWYTIMDTETDEIYVAFKKVEIEDES